MKFAILVLEKSITEHFSTPRSETKNLFCSWRKVTAHYWSPDWTKEKFYRNFKRHDHVPEYFICFFSHLVDLRDSNVARYAPSLSQEAFAPNQSVEVVFSLKQVLEAGFSLYSSGHSVTERNSMSFLSHLAGCIFSGWPYGIQCHYPYTIIWHTFATGNRNLSTIRIQPVKNLNLGKNNSQATLINFKLSLYISLYPDIYNRLVVHTFI